MICLLALFYNFDKILLGQLDSQKKLANMSPVKALTIVLLLVLFVSADLTMDQIVGLVSNSKAMRLLPDVELTASDNESLFRTFVAKYNRPYHVQQNETEYKYRLEIFVRNVNKVKKMNAKTNRTTFGAYFFIELIFFQ